MSRKQFQFLDQFVQRVRKTVVMIDKSTRERPVHPAENIYVRENTINFNSIPFTTIEHFADVAMKSSNGLAAKVY